MLDLANIHCPDLAEREMMTRIVRIESSGNPFAIGVVGGRLKRQPADLQEALSTVDALEKAGHNYSIGLSQVNRVHFKRLEWTTKIQNGFDTCQNLRAGADVYTQCKASAMRSRGRANPDAVTRAALSCYYSGNFTTGEKTGYVDKVLNGTNAPRAEQRAVAASNFQSMFD